MRASVLFTQQCSPPQRETLASAPPGELRRELGRGALAIVSLRDGEAVKAVPKALLIALRCTQDALREQSALQAACTGSDVPHVLPRLLGTLSCIRRYKYV